MNHRKGSLCIVVVVCICASGLLGDFDAIKNRACRIQCVATKYLRHGIIADHRQRYLFDDNGDGDNLKNDNDNDEFSPYHSSNLRYRVSSDAQRLSAKQFSQPHVAHRAPQQVEFSLF